MMDLIFYTSPYWLLSILAALFPVQQRPLRCPACADGDCKFPPQEIAVNALGHQLVAQHEGGTRTFVFFKRQLWKARGTRKRLV
jgi:hypothetical protein